MKSQRSAVKQIGDMHMPDKSEISFNVSPRQEGSCGHPRFLPRLHVAVGLYQESLASNAQQKRTKSCLTHTPFRKASSDPFRGSFI